MLTDTLQTIKPLTRQLEEALMECYDREQKNHHSGKESYG